MSLLGRRSVDPHRMTRKQLIDAEWREYRSGGGRLSRSKWLAQMAREERETLAILKKLKASDPGGNLKL